MLPEPGEAVLAGVTVTLTGVDRDGQPYTLTTTTSDTGAYELRYLNVGEHTITFGPPSGWTPTAPGGDSDAPSIKLNLSEQVTRGVDAGFRQPGIGCFNTRSTTNETGADHEIGAHSF